MSPDELRLLTDPAARNDPNFVRHVRSGMRQQTRGRVFGMLRTMSLVFGLIGLFMLGLSGVLGLGALASRFLPLGVPMDALGGALFLSVFGVVMTGVGVWTWVPSRGLLTSGVQATASVVQVLAMGNGISIKGSGIRATVSTVTVLLRVMPPNGAPYDITHKERILGSDIGSLQVGATVPVRISPSSPQKLLIDWDAMG